MENSISLEEITSDEKSVMNYVKATPFFSDLEQDEMILVTQWFKAYRAGPGVTIFKEGNQSSQLCLVAEGVISIFKEISSSEHLRITEIKAGGSIGEMGILEDEPASATAIASIDSVVFMISGTDFKKMISENEKIGNKFLWKIAKTISVRLRKTTSLLTEIS
jgi:CRP/FNR family transcriptional regulator, cyclic AMP receptor protein